MTETRSAESIFHAARALVGEPRERYLTQACGGDASLRAEVDVLLAADANAGSFLAPADDPDATIPKSTLVGSPQTAFSQLWTDIAALLKKAELPAPASQP